MRARVKTAAASTIDPAEALGLFRRLLPGPSWRAWSLVLRCALGATSSLTAADRRLIADCTGSRPLPTEPVRELWNIDGRRSGKTTFDALLAVAAACFSTYRPSRGERPVVLVIAADRTQAGIVFDTIDGMLESSPSLAQMKVRQTADTIDLSNRVRIQVAACSYRSTRGFTCLLCIADEVAFWRTDDSRNPDAEVLAAIRPSLMTTGGMLVCSSTPYSRRGELHKAHERYFGKSGPVLVWKAPSLVMNPSLDASRIANARAEDPAAAASEWDAEFRQDISAFLDPEALAACVDSGVRERPPQPGVQYYAFCDPSGGSQDSMTLAVAHADGDKATLDLTREITAPFNPRDAVAELVGALRPYRISRVTGDAYSAQWVRSAFDSHGIRYDVSDKPKSVLYLEALPLINSRRVSLLDDGRLRSQFLGLERRSGRSGRDSVDHGPSGHDDVVNAAAGALVLTKVSLGRAALPDAFTFCLRAASEPSFRFSRCYLAGGTTPASDNPEICNQCAGHKAAVTFYRRYIADGGTEDLRTWAKSNIKLPEALGWSQAYAQQRENEEAAGRAYDRITAAMGCPWAR